MKMDLSGSFFSILVTIILVGNGNRCGHKLSLLLPLVGSLISSIFLTLMANYSLPLPYLFAVGFVCGIFGGIAAFFGGAFSFIVCLCKTQREKTIRIAVVEMIFGIGSGAAGLSSGFFIRQIGFMWTFAMISLLHLVNIFYCTFFLGDTMQESEFQPQSLKEGLKETFSGIYLLFKSGSCKKRIVITLLLCTFVTYFFTVSGRFSLYTLYELNAPLCWNEVYIGYGSAASTLLSVSGFIGVAVLSRCLKDIYLVLIGIFSYIGGSIMTAFATTTLLMFLANIPALLCFMPIPVLRAMLSKVVLPKELGAVFACIACLEVVIGTIAVSAFESIYAVTVAWFPGFSFLLSAGLCIIPLCLLGCLVCTIYREEDFVQLLNEEDSSGEIVDS